MGDVKTIDEYIGLFPEDVQLKLTELRNIIKKYAPDAVETISYQMPTYKLNGNLVHFAAYKNHIGFYPTPSAIVEFSSSLTKYKTSKGAIQFPLEEPLPISLISEIIKFRVTENQK